MDPQTIASLVQAGRVDDAIGVLVGQIDAAPTDPRPARLLGILFAELGRYTEAASALVHAQVRGADDALTWFALGTVLQQAGLVLNAPDGPLDPERCQREAVARDPLLAAARANLALAQFDRDAFAEALATACAAVIADPGLPGAWDVLGRTLGLARLDPTAGLAAHRRAHRSNPNDRACHMNLISALDHGAGDATAQRAARRDWAQRHAPPAPALCDTLPTPDCILRVGYVSGDFTTAIGGAFNAVLAAHDRAQIKPLFYDTTDPAFAALDAAAAARRIAADSVDILVDLSGHATGQRLDLFARRPAPIQLTGFGLPFGTGLTTIDGLLLDPVSLPDDFPALEPRVTIAAPMAWAAPDNAPDPGPLPANLAGHLTIGVFNRPEKLTPVFFDLLGRIAALLPSAQFLFKQRRWDSSELTEAAMLQAGRHGVAADRLRFVGTLPDPAAHLSGYAAADLALDSLPFGGGLTTLETLWMGVPVLTIAGATLPGRITAGLLAASGLGEWVAPDSDGLIDRLLALTADLAAIRAGLRARIAAAAPFDPPQLARSLEDAYRRLWLAWCHDRNG